MVDGQNIMIIIFFIVRQMIKLNPLYTSSTMINISHDKKLCFVLTVCSSWLKLLIYIYLFSGLL